MTVEEAWARVQEEREWTPAWKKWSRQIVRPGGQGSGLKIDLVPPTVAEEEAEWADGDRGEWEEEELEAFLQQCELGGQLESLGRGGSDGRNSTPKTEEQGPSVGEGRGQVAMDEAERIQPPPTEQRRATGRREGAKKVRQRWRPFVVQAVEGEPHVEEALIPRQRRCRRLMRPQSSPGLPVHGRSGLEAGGREAAPRSSLTSTWSRSTARGNPRLSLPSEA